MIVDYQTISIVLTGTGLMIALTYYALQIRNQNKTRQAQLYMDLYKIVSSEDFRGKYSELMSQWEWEDLDDYRRKYDNTPEAGVKLYTLLRFYGGLNGLVKRRMIDVGLLGEILGASGFADDVRLLWEKFYPVLRYEVQAEWHGVEVSEFGAYREGYETYTPNVEDLYYAFLKYAEQQQRKGINLPRGLQNTLQRERERLAKR
jgi:hypothetical protein